jgi:hypothetical protein
MPICVFLILLLSTLSLLIGLCYADEVAKNSSLTALRLALLQSLLGIAVLVFGYTELFSLFNALNPFTAGVYWLLVNLILVGIAYGRGCFRAGNPFRWLRLSGDKMVNRWALVGLIFLVLPLLGLALLTPPNNFDSHHYHLNRVLCWLQNGNVEHFPTMYVQQLYHNVLAEYGVLTTLLLGGSDQFVALVQFGAMIGSVAGISLLAKAFGLSARGQFVAAVLLFCLPIGLFESTTTQVDYTACFFFITFLVFGYAAIREGGSRRIVVCLLALAFGGFTKYTILLFGFPFAIYFGVQILRKWGWRYALQTLAIGLAIFASVFGPFWGRNYRFFGHVLGPTFGSRIYNEKIPVDSFSVVNTLTNTLKNLSLHMGLPLPAYNQWFDALLTRIHQTLGVPLFDPATSYDAFQAQFSLTEDTAPGTLHLLLMGLVAAVLLFRLGHGPVKWLLGLGLLGLLLFSTLLKFQLWSTRTQMPFFAVGCVAIAYVYERVWRQRSLLPIAVFYSMAAVVVYGNPGKMLVPVRYVAKRLTAHIPRDICPANPTQDSLFRAAMSADYAIVSGQSCYLLRGTPNYGQRRAIFNRLDSIGYYDREKQSSVWSMTRTDAYFTHHQADHAAYAPLLPHLVQANGPVGVLFKQKVGYYHFWSALAVELGHSVPMQYVSYPREYEVLPNAHRSFDYQIILADDLSLVKRLIPAQAIDRIYTSKNLIFVKLKARTRRVYLY